MKDSKSGRGAPPGLQRIKDSLDQLRSQLEEDRQDEDTAADAVSLWICWPSWKESIESIANFAAVRKGKLEDWTAVIDGKEYFCPPVQARQSLAWAFESTIRYLMRCGRRHNIDTKAMARCKQYVCGLIMSDQFLDRLGHSDDWPAFLGPKLHELPDSQQAAILEAEAAFEELLAAMEIDRTKIKDSGVSSPQKPPANERMLAKFQSDPETLSWSAERWGQFLGVSAAAVKQTPTWKQLMKLRQMNANERR